MSIASALLFCPMIDCQKLQCSLTESFIASPSCRVIRVIQDPATRKRWLLVRDLEQPDAPALLVGVPTRSSNPFGRSKPQTSSLPVIHSGDHIVVSEKTSVAEGRFDATALNAAAVGEPLTIRLKLGGSVLRAQATAPGRATLVTGRSEASE